MNRFRPDGFYNGVAYWILPDSTIEAKLPHGLVKFKHLEDLVASCRNLSANAMTAPNEQTSGVPASAGPMDYYSILLAAINTTQHNSAQLRALVYERARFNLKRDILFGSSLVGLADVAQQIRDFETAVSRIEANAVDNPTPALFHQSTHQHANFQVKENQTVQILPPKPTPPIYIGLKSARSPESAHSRRLFEELVRHTKFTNKFIATALVGLFLIAGTIFTAFWFSRSVPSKVETISSKPIQVTSDESAANEDGVSQTAGLSKLPFPLPTSYGMYVLSENKLAELQPLPIGIPDSRIALSAEIDKPSSITIPDQKPAFILFRRDLANSIPQKIMLRVIARTTKETKIVNGKAQTSTIEGAWRIRSISRELKISPIQGHREMVIARIEEDVSLSPGRYALVLDRTGYDFAVSGASQSPVFCLEKFETTNGSVFNQCRTP